ncbi:hypothetical protein AMTRI_Chr12g270500 [Amborella trichopoda]
MLRDGRAGFNLNVLWELLRFLLWMAASKPLGLVLPCDPDTRFAVRSHSGPDIRRPPLKPKTQSSIKPFLERSSLTGMRVFLSQAVDQKIPLSALTLSSIRIMLNLESLDLVFGFLFFLLKQAIGPRA